MGQVEILPNLQMPSSPMRTFGVGQSSTGQGQSTWAPRRLRRSVAEPYPGAPCRPFPAAFRYRQASRWRRSHPTCCPAHSGQQTRPSAPTIASHISLPAPPPTQNRPHHEAPVVSLARPSTRRLCLAPSPQRPHTLGLEFYIVHLWEQTTSILKLKDQIEGKGRHERTLLPGHDRGIIVG